MTKVTWLRMAGFVVMLLALPVAVAGMVSADSPAIGTPGASPSASPGASPSASPVAGVQVAIVDYGFEAPMIEVSVGTTVTWTNTGGVIHTTTSTDGLWDSTLLRTGESFSYTFTAPGTYAYQCALHTTMQGVIVVTP